MTLTLPIESRVGSDHEPIPANTPTTLTLGAGDVLQVLTPVPADGESADLTGSMISASSPVQVIAGHGCTNVPLDEYACDHLEESMLPLETLSADYVLTAPASFNGDAPRPPIVRLIATQANTEITFNPPIHPPHTLAQVGDFLELPSVAGSFALHANHRVLATQYMRGQTLDGLGDPSMAMAVPVEQYRRDYLFYAPPSYQASFVNVVAPIGAKIDLDEFRIIDFEPLSGTGWMVARVKLSEGSQGSHHIVGDQPFGITVYGYGDFTSYWYPGGLNLEEVIID